MRDGRVELQPMGPHGLGVEVRGIAAADAGPAEIEALMQILAEHGVVVLRDQALSPPDYVAFARRFGELERSTRERYWLPEQPEIYVISNVVENGRQIGNPDDGFFWHTDQYYFERPTAYTFLYGIETPPEGADTQFCSTRRIYDELPEEERARLSRIRILASHAQLNAWRRREGKPVDEEEMDKLPDVVQPLVRTHPITGRKFLYFSAPRASKPLDMDEAQQTALLKDLLARATRADNVYSHRWHAKDLVIWDNRGLLHVATAYDKARHRRIAHRLSVIGERPY